MVDYAKGVGQGIMDRMAHPTVDTLKDAAVGVYDLVTDPEGTARQVQAQSA